MPWPDLDETDLRMIRALQQDGRASLASMAKTLELSVGAVRQRYERLSQRGLVRAVALVDPAALGRRVVAHIQVTVGTGFPAVARRLATLDKVAWLAMGADYRTVYLQVSTRTNAELVRLLNEQIRPLPGVTGVSTAILLRNWAPVFNFGGAVEPAVDLSEPDTLWRRGEESARNLDDVDRALLHCLERDARMTITAMTEEAGLSVPATRQRLVKLIKEGVVRIRTRPSPLAAGITTARLVLGIRADSTEVAAALTTMPNISYVSESSGEAILTAELVCATEDQVREGYERACACPGVTEVRVIRYERVLVHAGHW